MLRNKRKVALKRKKKVEEKLEEQITIKQTKTTENVDKEMLHDPLKDIVFTQSDLDSDYSDSKNKEIEIDLQDSDSDEERNAVDIFEARIEAKKEVVETRVPVYHDSDSDDADSFNLQEYNKTYNQKAAKWPQKKVKPDENLSETSNLISKNAKILSSTHLDIVKLINVNNEDKSARRLTICEFNPKFRAALTAAKDTRFHLFAVDGKTNEKILSSKFEQFTPSAAHFLDGGKQILFTSNIKQMYVMNLFPDKNVAKKSTNTYGIKQFSIRGIDDTRFPNFKVSPNNLHIVFLSRNGQMHVVHQKTKRLIKTISGNGSKVEDVCFYDEGNMMMSLDNDGNIYTWDMKTLKGRGKYFNADLMNGTRIACTHDGTKFACGTKSGCVDMFQFTSSNINGCKHLKTFKNLRTTITQLKFSNSGEILAMASSETLEGIKLAHVANQSIFPNFPLINRKGEIGNVVSMDFSPNDGYMMIGNNKGEALLYRLNYYTGY